MQRDWKILKAESAKGGRMKTLLSLKAKKQKWVFSLSLISYNKHSHNILQVYLASEQQMEKVRLTLQSVEISVN